MRALHVPALVLHGRNDAIPVDTAQVTAECLGAELHIVEQCGHVPHVEQLERLTEVVGAWL